MQQRIRRVDDLVTNLILLLETINFQILVIILISMYLGIKKNKKSEEHPKNKISEFQLIKKVE